MFLTLKYQNFLILAMIFCLDHHRSGSFSTSQIKMSSPRLHNLDHEDYNVDEIPFHASDDLWQLLEDDSSFQDINNSLDPNITFHEENSSAAEASDNNLCAFLIKKRAYFLLKMTLQIVSGIHICFLSNKIQEWIYLLQKSTA